MQYLPLALVVVGSALIIAALMHRASSTRRVVREATSVRPESSAPDWDRAAWLIAGAFTLLGVLQLNTYIERQRVIADAESVAEAVIQMQLDAERRVEEIRARLTAEGKHPRSLVR